MAQEEQPMWSATYLAPPTPIPSIIRPNITEEVFEVKGQFLHMVRELQFDGRSIHDPFQHIDNFIEICDLFKNRGVSEDAIRLRVFPLTLVREAKEWLKSLPPGKITTWELLRVAFISQYFPPAKADQLRIEINGFGQRLTETLTDAWDRYKAMLRSCPTHNLTKDEQIKIFYRGIGETSQMALDQSSGGIFMYKTASQAYQLLDDMANHRRSWTVNPKAASVAVPKNETTSALQAQVSDLTKKLDLLASSVLSVTKIEKPLSSDEEVNYLGSRSYQGNWNNNRNNYQNNNNYQARNGGPPGFQGYNNQSIRQPHLSHPSDQPSSSEKMESISVEALEDILRAHVLESTKITTELQRNFLKIDQNQRSQQASIQNVERDIGRIAQALSEKSTGGLPSNTKVNPRKETINAIFTRSGAQVTPENLEGPVESNQSDEEEEEIEEIVVEQPTEERKEEKGVPVLVKKATQKGEPSKAQSNETSSQPKQGLYKPKIPFPQRLAKEKIKEKYSKFADLIKQVHINVPLVDLISGMPHYGKFMKDLISDKSLLEDISCIQLGEECSAAMTKMPPKLGDTGSFTIPCYLGDTLLCNALADLGASINLMPLSLFSKLGLGELKTTQMGIQLADRSVKYPLGIAENVPVKVDRFVFPVDFVVLDIKEDSKVPIILGRPFLNTADAVIHVNKKILTLGVGNDRISFNVDKVLKQSEMFDDKCFSLDVIDECVEGSLHFTPR